MEEKAQPKNKKTLILVGGVILTLLTVAALSVGGYWVYLQFFDLTKSEPTTTTEVDESPNTEETEVSEERAELATFEAEAIDYSVEPVPVEASKYNFEETEMYMCADEQIDSPTLKVYSSDMVKDNNGVSNWKKLVIVHKDSVPEGKYLDSYNKTLSIIQFPEQNREYLEDYGSGIMPVFYYRCGGSLHVFMDFLPARIEASQGSVSMLYYGGRHDAPADIRQINMSTFVYAKRGDYLVFESSIFSATRVFTESDGEACLTTNKSGDLEYIDAECLRERFVNSSEAQAKANKITEELIYDFRFE